MTSRHAFTLSLVTTALLTTLSGAASQTLLVLCAKDTCEFRRVATVLVGGRTSVRGLAPKTGTAGPTEMKRSREMRVDQVPGLYRDPRSGAFFALGPDGRPREIVVPAGFNPKSPTPVGSAWEGAVLEYTETANQKSRTPVAPEAFAYLINAADLEQGALNLAQWQVDAPDEDPRRAALIRGAVQFAAQAPGMKQWRDTLVTRMRDALKRFDEQNGDPATLGVAIREAAQLRSTYMQIANDNGSADLLASVASENDLFDRRVTIADSLRKAAFWDDYLTKVRQVGLAKWSMPDILKNLREALHQSAQSHLQLAKQFTESGNLDRAFDEAEMAAQASCEPAVSAAYYNARVLFVTQNHIASSGAYSGRNKALLEQLVRELEPLDPNKERLTLDRIAQGEALDPNFLPLQWKKADFLDKLGRYGAALDVVRRIERTIRLDPKELEMCLGLDGRIRNNLTDTLQKSLAETRKQFDLQRYPLALDAAAKGLRADPFNASLLYYSALSASFLRDRPAAIRYVQAYLRHSNVSCAAAGEPERMLELYRALAARPPAAQPSPSNGIPHWISGLRYAPGDVFYDPVSMGFLQPVSQIVSKDGPTTTFTFEDRSFLVRSISTQVPRQLRTGSNPAATIVFEAEPKYDRTALSMIEIGPRATSAGERTAHAVTYLNSPGVDPDLVFRFTGRQIARGWAGNPFFHPFIWSGFYIFDLTYDSMGRIATATPIRESASSRVDPFSESLQFTWDGESFRLLSIRGTRTGYLRELTYDKDGRLRLEKISFPKGRGSIQYEYDSNSPQLKAAKSEDNFYDKRERVVQFDLGQKTR